jgi:hypothetical protein
MPWYMGSEQRTFQLSAIFVPALPMTTRPPEKAQKPPSPAGLGGLREFNVARRRYCSGGFFSEPGLTERMKVMIFQS